MNRQVLDGPQGNQLEPLGKGIGRMGKVNDSKWCIGKEVRAC